MITVGLTGGIGSGKSTAARIFESLGAYIIDADAISRDLTNNCAALNDELAAEFGAKILNPSGRTDRTELAKLVFSDKEKLKKLNEITHKYIFAEMLRRLKKAEADPNIKMTVLDVPLLFADDFVIPYDCSVAVVADDETRIRRVMRRDNAEREDIVRRMKNQLSNSELISRADHVIDNSIDDTDRLTDRVRELYLKLITK